MGPSLDFRCYNGCIIGEVTFHTVECTISSFSSSFEETYAIFLEFDEELNTGGGSSLVDDNLETTQSSPTPRRLHCLKLTDVGREYIEVVKGDLQNQMLELQSQSTSEGSQPLSRDKICEIVFGRRLRYSKGFGWGSKPKFRKTTNARSSSTIFSQARETFFIMIRPTPAMSRA
ncbi:cytochrome P450 CYP82D47-like [Cucumis melo var. makuwa]|uniref:Cytochrome P450 CYP82D47-like n=1 Tax=Cucumis melo var. makuwa TaxID=1194695 RepID=A0A5A7SU93_CUCMM|nr:cytochrome P450 CYP82D47-like [Cucumis melo var. makuwa]